MEQILLYIVTISGFSGFMLGLYSLLIPVLQRRGIRLPFVRHDAAAEDEFDYGDEDPDARQFAATSFRARRSSLLERLPTRGPRAGEPDDDFEQESELEDEDEEEEELLGDLDLSKERAEIEGEDGEEFEDDKLAELTFDAEVDPVLEALADEEDLEGDDEGEEDDEDEDEDEYEDDEDEEGEEVEAEPEKPVVQVVSGGGNGNDMLALFDEGSNVYKEIETWRADLPDPTIDELLAEARQISAMIKGRRPRA